MMSSKMISRIASLMTTSKTMSFKTSRTRGSMTILKKKSLRRTSRTKSSMMTSKRTSLKFSLTTNLAKTLKMMNYRKAVRRAARRRLHE
jgi:hypothetical protein